MKKLFDRLFFAQPMTLGDSFVCNGAVHHFADRCEELHLPINPKFEATLKTLYQDFKNIKIVHIEDPVEENSKEYCRQNNLSRINPVYLINSQIKNFRIIPMWDLQYYTFLELSYELRYKNFRSPAEIKGAEELYWKLTKGNPYVLVHRCSNDWPDGAYIDIPGYRKNKGLPDLPIIEIKEGITDNLMQFVPLIERASELHCVPSSIHCLADGLKTTGKLYFHDVREKTSMAFNNIWNEQKWEWVCYGGRQ